MKHSAAMVFSGIQRLFGIASGVFIALVGCAQVVGLTERSTGHRDDQGAGGVDGPGGIGPGPISGASGGTDGEAGAGLGGEGTQAGTGVASSCTPACDSDQTCVAGSCAAQECAPGIRFCLDNALRRCADDGLSSALEAACGAGQYCDGASVACKAGVCAPHAPACADNRATWCNSDATGYLPGGTDCGSATTCDAGACKVHLCAPRERFCQGQSLKACADDGLSSTVEQTCKDQTCLATSGSVKCVGECAPGQARCGDNGVDACDPNGAFKHMTDCTASNQTCVTSGESASCEGECAPGLKRCLGNRVQYCDGQGTFVNDAGDCTASNETCVESGGSASCEGECAPGQTQACAKGLARGCGPLGVLGPCELPSCQNLAANCGAAGSVSCCASAAVAGGTFDRINDSNVPATVSDFRLDRFEVTVGRWRWFSAAWEAGWRPSAGAGKHAHLNGGSGLANSAASGYEVGWQTDWASGVDASESLRLSGPYTTWTESAGPNENLPVNYVNWYEAYAFCIWDGGFLPSEAEQNYASAGGGDAMGQRTYPWSNPPGSPSIDCSYANYRGAKGGTFCYEGKLTEVGRFSPKGDGRYGQSDLAGNLWEWTLDWLQYPYSACHDCANLPADASTGRVVRGGAFDEDATYQTTAYTQYYAPLRREYYIGARCARRP